MINGHDRVVHINSVGRAIVNILDPAEIGVALFQLEHRKLLKMASLVRSSALRALKPLLNITLNDALNPRAQTLSVRAFSTALSPPSKAVVYEQHGPPDSVTRSLSKLLLQILTFSI